MLALALTDSSTITCQPGFFAVFILLCLQCIVDHRVSSTLRSGRSWDTWASGECWGGQWARAPWAGAGHSSPAKVSDVHADETVGNGATDPSGGSYQRRPLKRSNVYAGETVGYGTSDPSG